MSDGDELLEKLQFWIGIAGEAIDALDVIAADDEEDWDRKDYAEAAAVRIRAKFSDQKP